MADECYSTGTAAAGSHFYFGGIPAGACPLATVVWPIDSDTYGKADATAAGATGELGTLALTGREVVAADPDLFGDIGALNSATLQVIEPCPDATIHTSTLDMYQRRATTPVMLSATANIVSTEGIAIRMLYTMGSRRASKY